MNTTSTPNQLHTKTPPAQKLKAKLLSSYYGHPIRDMKLICITGTTGKSTVAHFVHQILIAAGERAAILTSESSFKLSTLHKFLNDAWKTNNQYVVVTAPATTLATDVFYGLPVHIAALTDFVPASLSSPDTETYLSAKSTLFTMKPDIVILNRDDAHYQDFAKFTGTTDTITYGTSRSALVRIDHSKTYKKGTEANLIIGTKTFTTASFLTGEPIVSYMAAAAAIANALKIAPITISEGIANYDPDHIANS